MDEIKLQSRIIDTISYYDRIMFVKLKDGKMFSYNGVPKDLFDEFAISDSHDEFYTKNIVPHFSFQRMM